MTQQRDRPLRGAVTKNLASGGPLGDQPVMQGLSMDVHIALQASKATRVADTDASVVREERSDDFVRVDMISFGVPGRGQQDSAAVEVELPGGPRA